MYPYFFNLEERRRTMAKKKVDWAAYDESLKQRGSITFWFSDEAIEAWVPDPTGKPGGQPKFSDLAIETALTFRLVFQQALRQTEGLLGSIMEMTKSVLHSNNIFIDETEVKLQEKKKCRKGYMWVVVGGNESNPPYRVYNFKMNRCHKNVLSILQDYNGSLHSDKYAAYQALAERKKIVWHPCWSHIRRKFFEAKFGDPEFRSWVLRKIRYLFMFEKVGWARSPEERLRIREQKEIPIIDKLIDKIKEKLKDNSILPKSKLKQAIGYFCGLIPYLKNHTKNPFARLDNNVAERAVRPLTIGRKNWMFFGSPRGDDFAFFSSDM